MHGLAKGAGNDCPSGDNRGGRRRRGAAGGDRARYGGGYPAQEDLPPFARSTVDGYAVRSADTFGASEAAAALWEAVGDIHGPSGIVWSRDKRRLSHRRHAADEVMPCDDGICRTAPTATLLVQKRPPNENVLTKGEDVACGAVLVEKGVRLDARHIGLLAACGCQEVLVRKRLKVGLDFQRRRAGGYWGAANRRPGARCKFDSP